LRTKSKTTSVFRSIGRSSLAYGLGFGVSQGDRAFAASYTHTYAPGTRRHIKRVLAASATIEEILEVLMLCVVQGVQAGNLGVPILAEDLAKRSAQDSQPKKRIKP
jgi:hypothetical protein